MRHAHGNCNAYNDPYPHANGDIYTDCNGDVYTDGYSNRYAYYHGKASYSDTNSHSKAYAITTASTYARTAPVAFIDEQETHCFARKSDL